MSGRWVGCGEEIRYFKADTSSMSAVGPNPRRSPMETLFHRFEASSHCTCDAASEEGQHPLSAAVSSLHYLDHAADSTQDRPHQRKVFRPAAFAAYSA